MVNTHLYKTVPQVSHVSVWNFFPDPDANNMDEAQYVIEHRYHALNYVLKKDHTLDLKLEDAIAMGENHNKEYWEDDLSDYSPEHAIARFEVLEYWGTADVSMLKDQQVEYQKI